MQNNLPPVSAAVREAEKIAVAAILSNTVSADDCEFTGLEFTNPEYRDIVVGALALTRDGSDLDIITLSNYLDAHKADYRDIAPNPQMLINLAQTPLPANVRPSIHLVHSNQARAKLTQLGASLVEWSQDPTDDLQDIIQRTVDSLNKTQGLLGKDTVTYRHLSEIAPFVQKQYDDFLEGIGHNIPTGLTEIDRVTMGGGAAGDVWVIGAPSGQGKSALMLDIAKYQAYHGYPTLIISREMLDEENYKRIHSSLADVPLYMIRPGVEPILYKRLAEASSAVQNFPIYIDSTASDIPSIRRSIEHAVKNVGVKAVHIDYLQLIKSTKRTNQRNEEVADVSRAFKEMAMDFKIWIMTLAQYNRSSVVSGQIENHSFSDSSQIEKDASVILHLELEKVPKGERPPKWRKAMVYMGKGRNAPNLSIELWFRGETFTFSAENPDAY